MTVFTPTKASGSHFYKYQSAEHLDRLKPIILEHLLYVPSVVQLNDPTDCRPKIKPMSVEEMVTFLKNDYIKRTPVSALDLLQEHESKIRAKIQTLGLGWFQRELSRILNSQMEQFGVYSLTKRVDNLSLWAKYAADHSGYCLEFVNEGPLFGEYVWEVVYAEYAPFDVNDSENRSAGFLVSKRPEWSNEEEVRLIRARGSGPVVKIAPQWLTRIILGKNMSPANQKQIRKWAKERDPELLVVSAYFDELDQQIRLKG
ncbi:MAG: DUF2971 domain-containing protein [Candidatus Acidiferrales bacterium]